MTTDRSHVTERDVGKRLLDAGGDEVGMIAGVEGDRIEVDPDPGTFDRVKARFGWKDRDQDTFTIDETEVADVTDDEVTLRENDPVE